MIMNCFYLKRRIGTVVAHLDTDENVVGSLSKKVVAGGNLSAFVSLLLVEIDGGAMQTEAQLIASNEVEDRNSISWTWCDGDL